MTRRISLLFLKSLTLASTIIGSLVGTFVLLSYLSVRYDWFLPALIITGLILILTAGIYGDAKQRSNRG